MPRLKILLLLLAPFLASAVLSEDLRDTNRDGRIDVSDVLTYFRSEAPSTASKQSARTPTYLILKISRDGLPVSDSPVTVGRSISGIAYNVTWTDTTDAWGVASITLTDDGKRPGGYFRIRAYDAGTVEKIGEWGSLPVRGGHEHLVACPIGGQPRILDRTPVDPPSVERVFMNADQWVRNGTLDQLEGFDTVRLSSYLPAERMHDVSVAGKQLMIGIAPPQAPLDAEFAGDVLDQYPASGALSRFGAWIDSLKWIHRQPIHAMMYNLEVSWEMNQTRGTPNDVSAAFADLVRSYCRLFRKRYPTSFFWTFSGPGPEFSAKIHYSADWDLLTTGPDAIDVCYTGHPLDVTTDDPSAELDRFRNDISATKALANDADVVWQVMTYSSDWETQRNAYPSEWERFKTLVAGVYADVTELNGHPVPITYYKAHYLPTTTLRNGALVTTEYTLDGLGDAPQTDIPWPDLGPFPARLWHDGPRWRWQSPQTIANRWEAEFLANFLVALDHPIPPVEVTEDETWSGTVILPGDVDIINATVTIEPGTEVRFRERSDLFERGLNPAQAELVIRSGSLVALGTETDPVQFRSTNLEAPTSGDWYGLRNTGGTLHLEHCVVRDASIGVHRLGGDVLEDMFYVNNSVNVVEQ